MLITICRGWCCISVLSGWIHLLHRRGVHHGHWHYSIVWQTSLHLPMLLAQRAPVHTAMHHAWITWGVLEMIFFLKLLPYKTGVYATHPPAKQQTLANKKWGPWINTMEYCSCCCKCNPTLNEDSMAYARTIPRHILPQGFKITPKQDTRAKESCPAAICIFGATKNTSWPRFNSRKLKAFW